jgi:hypothetical protein
MKYAFNNNGILQDVIMNNPNFVFPENYANQFIEVPDEALTGMLWDGKTLSAPIEEALLLSPTKEQLMAELAALTAKIQNLE